MVAVREHARVVRTGLSAQLWDLRCLSSFVRMPLLVPRIVTAFSWETILQRPVANGASDSGGTTRTPDTGGWRIGTQQDANEFIVRLLQTIDNTTGRNIQSPSKNMKIDMDVTYTCTDEKCRLTRTNRESMHHIVLRFVNDPHDVSMEQMLRREFETAVVSLRCSCSCDTATRSVSILPLPEYVQVMLSRFAFTPDRNVKLNTRVAVPLQLNFAWNQGADYRLCAAVVHKGTRSSGHYYSYIIQPDWAPNVILSGIDYGCLSNRFFHSCLSVLLVWL
jgi:hypothetical protein